MAITIIGIIANFLSKIFNSTSAVLEWGNKKKLEVSEVLWEEVLAEFVVLYRDNPSTLSR